jgi:hypothetical protein
MTSEQTMASANPAMFIKAVSLFLKMARKATFK